MKKQRPFPPGLIWLLVGLTLGWGINWPIMKGLLSEMEPMRFRTMCLAFRALGLFVFAFATGLRLDVPRGQWRRVVAVGLVYMAGWNICAVYGVQLMASGRAAILGDTMPAWGAIPSVWILGERLTARRVFGVGLAMGGACFYCGKSCRLGRSPLGALFMLGVALSWAISTVMINRWPVDLPTSSIAAWQIFIGLIPILGIGLAFESGPFNPFSLSVGPMLAIFYNISVAFIFCYWTWMKIALFAPISVSSLAYDDAGGGCLQRLALAEGATSVAGFRSIVPGGRLALHRKDPPPQP